jgi:hypothetical protein
MGWNSGGELMDIIAKTVDPYLPGYDAAEHVYGVIIAALEDRDCDVLDESFGVSAYLDYALECAGYHNNKKTCEWISGAEGDRCTCGWNSDI